MTKNTAYFSSPLGILEITSNGTGIESLAFENQFQKPSAISFDTPDDAILQKTIIQLEEYFVLKRKNFDIPLAWNGTDFQKNVWSNLLKIPFGQMATYASFTKSFTTLQTIRAVASANGKNKIGILVPCHRVVGKDGALTGYAGEIWRKKWLLEHEGSFLF